ncbi:MAG TPA: TIGR03086 family protein, partial [Patescibacteria group bacterium]|nr:TIGR03086 family protein [Patescibacteria group bacterium]
LVNHMLYELSWIPDLLEGKTVAEVGNKYDGDLLGKDHHQAWHLAAHKAATAVQKVDLDKTVHLSFADVDAKYYVNQVAGDLLLHAWDADQSLQCSLVFANNMAQTLYDIIEPQHKGFAASGLFASPQKVPKTARIQAKLLALVGRREPAV